MYRTDILNDQIIKRAYYEHTKKQHILPKNYRDYNELEAFFDLFYKDTYSPSTVCVGSNITCGNEFMIRADSTQYLNENNQLNLDNANIKKALNSYMQSASYSKS